MWRWYLTVNGRGMLNVALWYNILPAIAVWVSLFVFWTGLVCWCLSKEIDKPHIVHFRTWNWTMPALDPIPERTNRDFSILHSARFKSNEKTPFWAQSWTPKSVPCNTEYLEVNGGRPQFYNNQQIYKKVIEWFESWRPWQQRTLLCGLTNRFQKI